MTASTRRWQALPVVAFALIAASLLIRLPVLRVRFFDPDEFQHLHSAWCVAKGLLPYRDYFEHHTPWLHLLLAPLFAFFDVETRTRDAFAFFYLARGLIWIASAGILALCLRLGLLWEGASTAWAGTALLATTLLFFEKTLEVRPDGPACLLLVAALAVLLPALTAEGRPSRRAFAASGLLLGAGVMFTQKLLFVLLGLGPAMLLHVFTAKGRSDVRARLAAVAWQAAGFLAPMLLTLAWFGTHGAARAFIECNFLVNLRWKARGSPLPILGELAAQNPFLVALAAGGFGLVLVRSLRGKGRPGDQLILLAALGPFLGLWLLPVPWHQYHLTFLPQAALLAGAAAGAGGRSLAGLGPAPRAAGLADAGLALLLLVAGLGPLREMKSDLGRSNADKLASIRFVLQNTTPAETVMDGYTGIGVFRPHAFRYFFLHAELRQMLSDAERGELLVGLRSGRIAPRLISFDGHLTRICPEVRAFFEESYETVEQGPIWARLYPGLPEAWRDEGPRALVRDDPAATPYVLVGQGWGEEEREAGVRFRSSRGRRSLLLVPIRRPGGFMLTLRARPGAGTAGFELALNRRTIGSARLEPGWKEYSFPLPAELLRPGFNRFTLHYPQAGPQFDPARRPGAVVAVEWLKLER